MPDPSGTSGRGARAVARVPRGPGRPSRGFTLIELMIVLTILAILATLVVPQLAKASSEAARSAIRRQVQTIHHQIEVYKADNAEMLPTADPENPMGDGGGNNGWGVLVSGRYLGEEPFNPYTDATLLRAGDADDARAETEGSGVGWFFLQSGPRIDVYGAGYDPVTDTLSSE